MTSNQIAYQANLLRAAELEDQKARTKAQLDKSQAEIGAMHADTQLTAAKTEAQELLNLLEHLKGAQKYTELAAGYDEIVARVGRFFELIEKMMPSISFKV